MRSNDELLRLAVDRALDGLFTATEEPASRTGPEIGRLEHLIRRSVAVLVEQLPTSRRRCGCGATPRVEREALARRREFDALVTELVRQAEAEGDVRPDVDPAATSRLLFGLVNSLTEWYRPHGAAGASELADAVWKVAFDGLRLAPARVAAEHRGQV